MPIRVDNSAIASVVASGDWTKTPTHGALWANGIAVDRGAFAAAIEQPENGDTFRLPVGTLRFDNAITNMNELGVKEIFDAAVEAGTITWKVSLHDQDPGATYTAGELTAVEAPGYVPGAAGRVSVTVRVSTV